MDLTAPTQDVLLERLQRVRAAKRNPGWASELLDLASELTMARHAVVVAKAEAGWNCLATTSDTFNQASFEHIAGKALSGSGIIAERFAGSDTWAFAASLGQASLTDPKSGQAILVVEITSQMTIDLILTRERMAFLAALSEAAITEAKVDHWSPLALATLALEKLRGAPDLASGLHLLASFIAKSSMPNVERLSVCLMKPFSIGVSDHRDIDLKGNLVHRLKTIAQEAISRGEPRILQGGDAPTLAEQVYRENFGCKEILTIPATNKSLVLLATFPAGTNLHPETANRLLPTANVLSSFDRKLLRSPDQRRRKLIIAGSIAVILGIVSLLPRPAIVEAPVTMRSEHIRVVTAPFDGILDSSEVQPGDSVFQDRTILARLATREIELELDTARAKAISDRRDAAVARANGQAAQEQISLLSARRAEAQVSLLEYRLRLAEMRAPADGILLSGDLRRNIGQPLGRGQTLFEIALPGALRAEILVLDEDVNAVAVGQQVLVAVAADPGRHRRATVERVRPMAEVVNGRNIFRVYARFEDTSENELRGGMEGWAKITVGTTNLLTVLTSAPIRWLRRYFFW
jgi:hypothetical protein